MGLNAAGTIVHFSAHPAGNAAAGAPVPVVRNFAPAHRQFQRMVVVPYAQEQNVLQVVLGLAVGIPATETDAPRSAEAKNAGLIARGQGARRIVSDNNADTSAPDNHAPKGDAIRQATLFRMIYSVAITLFSNNAIFSPEKQVLIAHGT